MKRRSFVRNTLAAGAGLAATGNLSAREISSMTKQREPFNLKYAPHFGMFRNLAGEDLVDQISFMADQGFTAFEDNEMTRRSVADQDRIAEIMSRRGMTMGVFVANFDTAFGKKSFTSGNPEFLESFLNDLSKSVEVAKRVNATWMTVVLGDLDPKLEIDYQTAHAVEMLKRGAEIFEAHNLVMVMEPLNPWVDHAGMFLSKIPQAYLICKAVDSPAVKILFDIYHQQITEGNLIHNIDKAWDEIAYFQIGDTPGRKEPTTGEINYLNVFRHIHRKGYDGVLGMEHGNSKPGLEGEQAVLDAYRTVDRF